MDEAVLFLLIATIALYLCVVAWRVVRLLALLQQKEYRLDRWLLFWRSAEGMRELWKLLPTRHDLSRGGFRRPKITARITITATIVFGFLVLAHSAVAFQVLSQLFSTDAAYELNVPVALLTGVLYAVALHITTPLWVTLALAPSVIAAHVITLRELQRARDKIVGKAHIIGITGSYGKTSTKQLLAAVLSSREPVFSTKRSFNTRFSVAHNINQAYSGESTAVIEYAAYTKGEIAELARWIPPNCAVITGLTEQHLGLFGSLGAIIAAKSELVKARPPRATVFYNADDPGALQIVRRAGRSDVVEIPFSGKSLAPRVSPEGQLAVSIPASDLSEGTHSRSSTGSKVSTTIQTNLTGSQYAGTVAAAVAVARNFATPDAAITRVLTDFIPTDNFITSYQLAHGTQLIDDGGSCNPAGFLAACELAKVVERQSRWLLFGGVVDLADEELSVHKRLATAAEPVFDQVLYLGEVGKSAFIEVFGDRVVSEREAVLKLLADVPLDSLLVIEGRVPGWLQTSIARLHTLSTESE